MDMEGLMAQAKQLQDKVSAAQDLLGHTSVKGISGNGAAIVDMTGKYDLIKLTLSPELLKQDLSSITEIISEAFRDAKSKADSTIDRVMGEATSGMPLPE